MLQFQVPRIPGDRLSRHRSVSYRHAAAAGIFPEGGTAERRNGRSIAVPALCADCVSICAEGDMISGDGTVVSNFRDMVWQIKMIPALGLESDR
jgi:hypothetical protein